MSNVMTVRQYKSNNIPVFFEIEFKDKILFESAIKVPESKKDDIPSHLNPVCLFAPSLKELNTKAEDIAKKINCKCNKEIAEI